MSEGWFADPLGRFDVRYHDGSDWTERVSDAGVESTDPLPPEEDRPLSIRRTCPICQRADIVVRLDPGPELLCLSCGASVSFSIVGRFTPDVRARFLADDQRYRAMLADQAAQDRQKHRGR